MSHPPANIAWIAGLCLAGLALTAAPPETTVRARTFVHDLLVPGQTAAQAVCTWSARVADSLPSRMAPESRALGDLRAELAQARQANALLQRQCDLARANRQERSSAAAQPQATPSQPLFVPQLVEARVLGEETASSWRGRQFVAAGRAQKITEEALVLEGAGLLIDQAQAAGLSAGDAVYAGRTVVGKIVEVGRYSSRVQPVTAAGYSGRARLARRTSRGLEFGAEGILVGAGDELCRLKRISDPVNVGDEVFTGGTDGVLPFPMYYGQVVRCELAPDATEWSVWVRPAVSRERLADVLVLRLALNPLRVLAN